MNLPLAGLQHLYLKILIGYQTGYQTGNLWQYIIYQVQAKHMSEAEISRERCVKCKRAVHRMTSLFNDDGQFLFNEERNC